MTAPRTLLVLDDDPTGSQCVHDVDVVLELDPAPVLDVVRHPGRTCFVLTNSRARPEAEAVAINTELVSAVLEALTAERLPLPHLVSRSDSTLRGHVIAEPTALADVLARHGVAVDGFLLAPAMLEAGRYTEDDLHYAVLQGRPMPVGETDFAADATFGYSSSDLKDFLVERSGGTVERESILSIGLEDGEGLRHGVEVRVLRGVDDHPGPVPGPAQDAGDRVHAPGADVRQADGEDRVPVQRPAGALHEEVLEVGGGVAEGGVRGEVGLPHGHGAALQDRVVDVVLGVAAGLEHGRGEEIGRAHV